MNFKIGDLVWGSNGSKSVWPGKILKFTSKHEVEIQWFGCNNKSVAVQQLENLKTLSEGLESHHMVRTKFRKSRKLSTVLEKAIQEAMFELDQQQKEQKIELSCSKKPFDSLRTKPVKKQRHL